LSALLGTVPVIRFSESAIVAITIISGVSVTFPIFFPNHVSVVEIEEMEGTIILVNCDSRCSSNKCE
jgi:hypothetical protein